MSLERAVFGGEPSRKGNEHRRGVAAGTVKDEDGPQEIMSGVGPRDEIGNITEGPANNKKGGEQE